MNYSSKRISATSKSPSMQQQQLRGPPHKIAIQAFSAPKLPESFETETWTKLSETIRAIYERRNVSESFEELYHGVETLCSHGKSGHLFELLQQEIDSLILREVLSLERSAKAQSSDDESFLALVHTLWTRHCSNIILIRNVFLSLDRSYYNSSSQQQQRPMIWEVALNSLRKHVSNHPETGMRAMKSLLAVVSKDRHGDAIDKTLASSVSRFLSAVSLYEDPFELALASEASNAYKIESFSLLLQQNNPNSSIDISEYLKRVEKRLQEETIRAEQSYLLPRSRKPLVSAVEHEMIIAHLPIILDRSLNLMLEKGKVTNNNNNNNSNQQQQGEELISDDDLIRLHNLCIRVGSLNELRKSFHDHVHSVGHSIVSDEKRDKTMITDLFILKARLEKIVSGPFSTSSQIFNQVLRDTFESFINERPSKPSELLAKFVDRQLRTSHPTTGVSSDTDIDAVLDRVVSLFRMIQGKDVFEAFYKHHLAKRLLLGRSASMDAERAMVAKLKSECGAAFTSKLEGMFKDMDVSEVEIKAFKGIGNNQEPKNETTEEIPAMPNTTIDLNVHVLTSSYWPVFPNVELTLPAELAVLQKSFTDFYTKKQSNKKITWQNGLGSVLLKANFQKGRKELQVTLPQATVLMAFNSQNQISFDELHNFTGIEQKELKFVLISLTTNKFRIIIKQQQQKQQQQSEIYMINDGFNSKLFRIKIPSARPKEETEKEDKKTQEDVVVDRQYQIDAAVVRIMKTRKHLSHTQLLSELFGQLKFPIKPADIKARIESLIEREYMERTKDDPQSYDYLA